MGLNMRGLFRHPVFIAGVGMLLLYLGLKPDWLASWYPLWISPRLVGEFGTAFVIAAIVSAAYESKARDRFMTDTVADAIAKTMGDIINPVIWKEMREQLLNKVALRKGMTVRLSLDRRNALEQGRCAMRVMMEYRLTSLRSNKQDIPVVHFVDKFMADPKLGLPRLRRVEIDGLAQHLHDHTEFIDTVLVGGSDELGKRILVDREELIYVPGAYNLLMSELTELEAIALDDVPDDVEVVVNCLFDGKFAKHVLTTRKAFTPRRFLLPGQSVEVRFEPRPRPSEASV